MVISKASPIKFWTTGNTYNQGIDSVAGVMAAIWNQKWNKDDQIQLQFYDEAEKDYRLRCYDEDDVLIDELTFTRELVNGVYIYSLSFNFEDDFSVTDQVVNLKIYDTYYDVTGAITDLIETVDGDAVFVDESLLNNVSGDINDLIETVDGDVVNSQTALFGYALPAQNESDACTLPNTPLYWAAGVTFAPGITLYSDPGLSTAFTGKSYISKAGVIYSINSGTGVVGAATGNLC